MKDFDLLIGMIVWGKGHHVKVFPYALASVVASVRYSGTKVKILILTDNQLSCENLKTIYPDISFEIRDAVGEGEICFERLRLNQQIIIDESNTYDVPFSYVAPDQIISQNSFKTCMELYEKGYAYVLFPSLRVKFETCLPQLRDDGVYNGMEIAELFFRHVHPIQSSIDWDKFDRDFFAANPWGLMRIFPKVDGAIMKAIHGCTFLVKPQSFQRLAYNQAVDCQYVEEGILDYKKVYVIKDCEEAATIDLSPATRIIPTYLKGKNKKWKLFKYLKSFGCSFNMRTPLSNTLIYSFPNCKYFLENQAKAFDAEVNHIFIFHYLMRFDFRHEKIRAKAILLLALDWLARRFHIASYWEKKLK